MSLPENPFEPEGFLPAITAKLDSLLAIDAGRENWMTSSASVKTVADMVKLLKCAINILELYNPINQALRTGVIVEAEKLRQIVDVCNVEAANLQQAEGLSGYRWIASQFADTLKLLDEHLAKCSGCHVDTRPK